METSVGAPPSVRSALTGLIDYAGLFPPAKLPIEQAEEEYKTARGGPNAWMLGRFIAPVSLLAAAANDFDAPLCAIVDAAADSDEWFESFASRIEALLTLRRRNLRIEALEIALPASLAHDGSYGRALQRVRGILADANLTELPCYVEFVRSAAGAVDIAGAIAAAAQMGFGAKLRCGGLTADAFPSVEAVAAFLAAASSEHVAFKATAGLHHPVRHRDAATGFEMHGFLNLLAATALATRVGDATLQSVLAEEDPSAFRFESDCLLWRSERIDVAQLEQVRAEAFVAFGSCSFSEPIDDLVAMGVLKTR